MKPTVEIESLMLSRIKVSYLRSSTWVVVTVTPQEWWERQYPSGYSAEHPAWQAFYEAIAKGYKDPGGISSFILERALDGSAEPEFDRAPWEAVASYALNKIVEGI